MASERCSSEAVLAFGNGEVFVEEYHLRVISIPTGIPDFDWDFPTFLRAGVLNDDAEQESLA